MVGSREAIMSIRMSLSVKIAHLWPQEEKKVREMF